MHFIAIHCIAQPNTALHDCILYPSQYLSRHFTGLCKSVHPWGHVSEIQSIKEMGCNRLSIPNASTEHFSGKSAADSKKPNVSCSCNSRRVHPLHVQQLHLLFSTYKLKKGQSSRHSHACRSVQCHLLRGHSLPYDHFLVSGPTVTVSLPSPQLLGQLLQILLKLSGPSSL